MMADSISKAYIVVNFNVPASPAKSDPQNYLVESVKVNLPQE